MQKTKNEKASVDIDSIKVKLKPVFGIQPQIYVPCILIILATAVIFFLLFYPGIRLRRTYFEFTTFPDKASVRIDGKYYGVTPFRALVPKGTREISISKAFYYPIIFNQNVRGRIIGTLFIPPRKEIYHELSIQDMEGLLSWSSSSFASSPYIPVV